MDNNITITLSDNDSPTFRQTVEALLDEYNRTHTNTTHSTPLNLLVTDTSTNAIVAGLSGRTSLGVLFIDIIFLPPRLRLAGLGTKLLKEAEVEAVRRGCVRAVVYTISFQAPDFYQRRGYNIFGIVPCLPEGVSRVFLSKDL